MIESIWYKKSSWSFVLWPFSGVFRGILGIRKKLYQMGLKKMVSYHCPIIVVGNITVGGTGKTPLVIALAQFFHSKGLNPAIITRGYKGQVKFPQFANSNSDTKIIGDEALLLARRTNCPVVVCPDRVAAVYFLLKRTNCNVILSDDGLQHLALGRKLEIAVIDSCRGLGNGFLLPAGPLREPKSRLETVDFCVANGGNLGHMKLKNLFDMHLQPEGIVNFKHGNVVDFQKLQRGKTIHAVAGIGNPGRFFTLLKAQGLTIIEHAFLDHHRFRQQDFSFLKENEYVIMTEKDAVKCEAFADERYWFVPVNAKLPKSFYEAIFERTSNDVKIF